METISQARLDGKTGKIVQTDITSQRAAGQQLVMNFIQKAVRSLILRVVQIHYYPTPKYRYLVFQGN